MKSNTLRSSARSKRPREPPRSTRLHPSSEAKRHKYARPRPRAGAKPKNPEMPQLASLATQAITVALGKSEFFSLACLVALSETSRDLLNAVRDDHVWRAFLTTERLGFGFRHSVDDSAWPNKSIPPPLMAIDAKGVSGGLLVPPRLRGERRDHDSWFPHAEDELANARDLVLDVGDICCCRVIRFNEETGAVEDLFHPADSPVGPRGIGTFREEIYLPRPLPITCPACDHVSVSYAEFVEHIKTKTHIRASFAEIDDSSPEWRDPRYSPSFDLLSGFEQVQVLMEFKTKVLTKLREPMNRTARRHMKLQLSWLDPPKDISDRKALRILCEWIVEAFPVNDFLKHGVRSYCREVLESGWESFEPHGPASEEAMYFGVFPRHPAYPH